MARGHGRILTSIWEDADFLTLSQERQRLYLFLISQPNLNHAGLLPLTLRRWTRKAADLTPSQLESHLADLDAARFIVMDQDTEELLIRSFVRNDGVWKQPKVMGAMVSGALEISSPRLRAALLGEMDRIPLDELSTEPTKVRNAPGPSIRQQVAEHIDTLRRAFKGTTPTPFGGGSGRGSASPSDTPANGGREASTRAGAGAHDARAPLPLPLPLPQPPTPSSSPLADVSEAEPSGDPTGPEEEDPTSQAEDALAKAENFLASLPRPWTTGPSTSSKLAPLLAANAAATGWDLDAALETHLTQNPGGIRRYADVLRNRIEDLPRRLVPRQASRKGCSSCGTTERTLTDGGLCLDCASGRSARRAPRPGSTRTTAPSA